MRLALYQPEIAQNVGAAVRVAACFGAGLDIIEPCGFPVGAKEMRRVAMDYGREDPPRLHRSWSEFQESDERSQGRLLLLTTQTTTEIWRFEFHPADILLLGQESAGAPPEVHEEADVRLTIPLALGARSLNMSVAGAVALAEARRQCGWD